MTYVFALNADDLFDVLQSIWGDYYYGAGELKFCDLILQLHNGIYQLIFCLNFYFETLDPIYIIRWLSAVGFNRLVYEPCDLL